VNPYGANRVDFKGISGWLFKISLGRIETHERINFLFAVDGGPSGLPATVLCVRYLAFAGGPLSKKRVVPLRNFYYPTSHSLSKLSLERHLPKETFCSMDAAESLHGMYSRRVDAGECRPKPSLEWRTG
jgi:hypothetical protein